MRKQVIKVLRVQLTLSVPHPIRKVVSLVDELTYGKFFFLEHILKLQPVLSTTSHMTKGASDVLPPLLVRKPATSKEPSRR